MKKFCENPHCESPGTKEVPVSVRGPGDQQRTLCAVCEEAYSWGVQHGRFEAEHRPLWIAVVTDRGMVAYARVFPSRVAAETALLKYLRRDHSYRGPKSIRSLYGWLGEHAYLGAEIVEQDSLVEA